MGILCLRKYKNKLSTKHPFVRFNLSSLFVTERFPAFVFIALIKIQLLVTTDEEVDRLPTRNEWKKRNIWVYRIWSIKQYRPQSLIMVSAFVSSASSSVSL